MKKQERERLLKWADTLSDYELETAYYDAVFDCLGSEAEEMYERGYCIADIVEREKYEKFLIEKSHVLEWACMMRGIPLWGEKKEKP